MLVKNILKIACDILGLENAYRYMVDETLDDEKAKSDANMLLKCFNLVYAELMTEYVPIIRSQRVMANSVGSVSIKMFSNGFFKVHRVLDRFKNNVFYEERMGNIVVEGGSCAYDVEYVYLDDEKENFDDSIVYDNYPSKRVIAYGVVSEYLLINGEIDEAQVWSNRFKQSLKNEIRKSREVRIKARRYL